MRANQVRNFLLACGQRVKEQRRVPELVLIRRIAQDLDRFRIGGLLLVGSPRESEVAECFLVINQQLIEESVTGIKAMAENRVAKLVRYDSCQAGFVGKHVDQAAA